MSAEDLKWTLDRERREAKEASSAELPQIAQKSKADRKRKADGVTYLTSAKIKGSLEFNSKAIINSEIEGDIHSSSNLVIEQLAKISGNISANNIELSGQIVGNIHALGQITLKRGAFVRGDLKCSRLNIEEGVVFEGYCDMESAQSSMLSAIAC